MLKKLRKERETLTAQMSAIAGTERSAGVGMTDSEKKSFDDAAARVKDIDSEIERIEEARSLATATAVTVHADNDVEEFRSWLRNEETRSQNTLTNGAGAYTVGSSVSNRVIEAVKSASGMTANASGISTAKGDTLSYPCLNDTGVDAVIVAEGDARRAGDDLVFTNVEMGAYEYDSGIIQISEILQQDSSVDIDSIVIDQLSKRIARSLNKDFTNGTGIGQPAGITTQSTLGVTAAATTAIAADELLDLQFSVDDAYASKGKYMMNSNTLLAVAKLKDSNGDYLISSAVDGMGRRLFGKPVIVNNDLPDMAAGSKSILFGDFSAYMVRTVSGLNVFKFNELYRENGMIGYKASMRVDGTLLDPLAVKHLIMAAA